MTTKFDNYPFIIMSIVELAIDNGAPYIDFMRRAERVVEYNVSLEEVEAVARKAWNTTFGDTAPLDTEVMLPDVSIGSVLSTGGEWSETQAWLNINTEYKLLDRFMSVAFGEQTPEEMGFTKRE